ncbi:Uncharacterized conserved protein, DUF1015 family [Saccharopolyspora antimicrobica]|uniref:Uncharacterized conserved protein, DUF1015 family n=1 Tax=Saccharopolyspora antimicrobica TaxID=455193 RepID=A0A1I4RXE0_9PSEU|nr:MFS transporter [Saccharopolyspora antimicrobica]RKT89183.1 uncharacterized protein (DUF1015 family) [Saccharopolyspora antimicrobica]SFM56905.1 Uncharacterized conserved protein, DUF1015 family [Saccharopolyspora antimicrobica]
MATAATPLALVAGRLLQGAFGGVVEAAAAFAGSTGSAAKRGSSLGKSFSATAAGALAGPIAGGLFVNSGGLPQLMLVIAGAAVALAISCAVGLHEPDDPGTDDGAPGKDRTRSSVMRVPGVVPLALAAAGAYFGVYGLIPVFAEHVRAIVPEPGSAGLRVGVLHSVMWGASLIGSFWWGKHNDRAQRPVRAFALAAAGCAASIAALALPLEPVALIPFRLVQGFCFAALAQSLFLHFGNHARAESRSAFVSTANSYLLVGQSAGPLLAGPAVGTLPVAGAVLLMAAVCGAGAILALGPARAEHDRPETPEETVPLPTATEPARSGVSVAPFTGWRIADHQLGAVATRYATPWERSTDTFLRWQRTGVLVRDQQPALYAYEQVGPHGTLRGVLGAVHLDSALLPHEDIIPERAGGIADLMHDCGMNLDPLLLGYSGGGRTSSWLARTTRTAPLAEVLANDGQLHRLWRIADPGAQEEIAEELASRAAFIADGHHRHAAARQLRREYYAAGDGPGPWDCIPGLLVDTGHSPLRLGPVHRVLPCADPHTALQAASTRFRVQALRGDLRAWLPALKESARHTPAYVVVTQSQAFLLTSPGPHHPHATDVPPALRRLHLSILHDLLIDKLWRIPDLPGQVLYETSAASAVRRVQQRGGLAVLLTPLTYEDLRNAAAAGVRLPGKSTSFGPKPHPGLIFRSIGEP